ncbi:hypothetical protein JR065_04700 [Xanthomonas sp. AmX2]|uniref:hypothetical protein n=1 Tax=Xanthomonas sp. TaxID=29446 RepID=UPI00197CDAEF|nr:hypothetical protein [Xanthomonas sp.]MBN6149630.1 hypothetical protein [Xanthomonas sp.]
MRPAFAACSAWLLALASAAAPAQQRDDYRAMLGYLADSRIDGRSFAGAQGAIAANLAAGDLNLQANLRSFASGTQALATVQAAQVHGDDRHDGPLHASARLGGDALRGASGLASINQASGSGNAELNSVAASLAQQGIREASDEALASSAVVASAGERNAGDAVGGTGTRSVAVEATALRGFQGVLQLNQIAGSGNAADNQFSLSVQAGP